MNIQISTLSERPDFSDALWDLRAQVPAFMGQDPVADLYFMDAEEVHRDYVLVAWEDSAPNRLIARGFSVPFTRDGGEPVDFLPDDGWDGIIRRAYGDRKSGRKPDAVSALEITVDRGYRGRGVSVAMVEAMRANARSRGFTDLFAPVRPNAKHEVPLMSMQEYLRVKTSEGFPADPWLRVHCRLGARMVKTAPRSMTVTGTCAEWRQWTGLPFDRTGPVVVPEALVPVHCFHEQDWAVYVEPNVWVHHMLQ
ncbi:N-acetyltransferase [Streptomyces cinereoruber]|uniref:N-acetyltransferase n=1 Tax=Streptomyces cinereoruber TaxID=67260 RepID=UPI003630B099